MQFIIHSTSPYKHPMLDSLPEPNLLVAIIALRLCLIFQLVHQLRTAIILTVPSPATAYANTVMARLKINTDGMHILGFSQEMMQENVVVSIQIITFIALLRNLSLVTKPCSNKRA